MLALVDNFTDRLSNYIVGRNMIKENTDRENEKQSIKKDLEKLKRLTRDLDDKDQEIYDLNNMYYNLFSSLWNGVIVFEYKSDGGLYLKDMNESAERVPFINKSLIGQKAIDIFPQTEKICEMYHYLKKVNKENTKENYTLNCFNEEGELHYWFECFIYKIRKNDIVIIFEDVTKIKRNEYVIERKNRLLNCALEVSRFLVNKCDIKDIDQILYKLAEATKTDRSFIFKNKDENIAELLSEFNNSDRSIKTINYDNVPEMHYNLESGHYICDSTIPSNSKDAKFCEDNNIVSFCMVPIYTNGKWWGFLGFEERKYKKHWTFDDIIILTTISDMLGKMVEEVCHDSL